MGGAPPGAALQSTAAGFRPDRLARLLEIESSHFWFSGRRALVLGLLRDQLARPNQLIAEIGCGSGSMLAELSERGHTVVGVDALPEALEAAASRAPAARLICADASALPLEPGRYDGVVLLDVIEHTDGDAALCEARRVLRPGAWAVVSVPAVPWLWSYRDVDAGHVRRYTRSTLCASLRGAGFTVDRVAYYQFFLFPLVVVARLLGRRGPALRDLEERPNALLNRALTVVNRLEAHLARAVRLPLGSTLVAVCRKVG